MPSPGPLTAPCEDCQAEMKVLLLKDPKEDDCGQDPYVRVSAWHTRSRNAWPCLVLKSVKGGAICCQLSGHSVSCEIGPFSSFPPNPASSELYPFICRSWDPMGSKPL